MARPSGRDIRAEAIDAAQLAMQNNASRFSYGEIADRLGVRAPSLHHHFRRKGDLIAAATKVYRADFRAGADALTEPPGIGRLLAYAELFVSPARSELLCLCGAVAGDWDEIDQATRDEVNGFFADEINWVRDQVQIAIDEQRLRPDLDASQFAQTLVVALEGALLVSRTSIGPAALRSTAAHLLALAAATSA